ncbi:hypothetical protein EMCRGX_G000424 [Ephydatia muelleri]
MQQRVSINNVAFPIAPYLFLVAMDTIMNNAACGGYKGIPNGLKQSRPAQCRPIERHYAKSIGQDIFKRVHRD